MAVENELEAIVISLTSIVVKVSAYGLVGGNLSGRDLATFNGLRIEAITLLDEVLGIANNFSFGLRFSPSNGTTLEAVQASLGMIESAIKHLRRGPAVEKKSSAHSVSQFVDMTRLAQLRTAKSSQFDLTRLNRLCEELNIAHFNNCFMATAMLGRAIMDHVPPLLGKQSFEEVANNYGGATSFRKSMQNLQLSLRNIADAHLHLPIRQKEVLPTAQQVDFHKDLDVLLGEIVRTLK